MQFWLVPFLIVFSTLLLMVHHSMELLYPPVFGEQEFGRKGCSLSCQIRWGLHVCMLQMYNRELYHGDGERTRDTTLPWPQSTTLCSLCETESCFATLYLGTQYALLKASKTDPQLLPCHRGIGIPRVAGEWPRLPFQIHGWQTPH